MSSGPVARCPLCGKPLWTLAHGERWLCPAGHQVTAEMLAAALAKQMAEEKRAHA